MKCAQLNKNKIAGVNVAVNCNWRWLIKLKCPFREAIVTRESILVVYNRTECNDVRHKNNTTKNTIAKLPQFPGL